MPDFTIKQGDTKPSLVATLQDANGAVDLTNATSVTLHMRSAGSMTNTVSAAVTITNRAAGAVSYQWQAVDTATAGSYYAEFEVVWNDGTIETFPDTGNLWIQIVPDLG